MRDKRGGGPKLGKLALRHLWIVSYVKEILDLPSYFVHASYQKLSAFLCFRRPLLCLLRMLGMIRKQTLLHQ